VNPVSPGPQSAGFGSGFGAEDDDDFGDDFDDFEEGGEDGDFDDFGDGFEQPEPAPVSVAVPPPAPVASPQPAVPSVTLPFVRHNTPKGDHWHNLIY
jgi:hypothetical protein